MLKKPKACVITAYLQVKFTGTFRFAPKDFPHTALHCTLTLVYSVRGSYEERLQAVDHAGRPVKQRVLQHLVCLLQICALMTPHGFQFHTSLICGVKCFNIEHKVCEKRAST